MDISLVHIFNFSLFLQQYTITAKCVGFTTEKEELTIYGVKKTKRNALLADSTSKVTIALYEKLIEQVEENVTYTFKNVSSRLYRNNFYLTTTSTTKILQADDLEHPSDVLLTAKSITYEGSIIQVRCTVRTQCPSCKKNIDLDQDASTLKCPGCHMKTKVSKLKQTHVYRINLQDNKNLYRLVCFDQPMNEFLQLIDKKQLLDNLNQLEDMLLSLEKVQIIVSQDSDIVCKITEL